MANTPIWTSWSEREKAIWTAAIIDGEGTITSSKREKKGLGFISRVLMTSTTLDLVLPLQKWYGGSVYCRRPPKNTRWNASYAWSIHGNAVIPMLETIIEFLILKKEVAELALALQYRIKNKEGFIPALTKRKDIYGNTLIYHIKSLSLEEKAIRAGYFYKMKELNYRGVKKIFDTKKIFAFKSRLLEHEKQYYKEKYLIKECSNG